MPYITPMQIEILDDLAARLGLEDPDGWVQQQAMFASEPPISGVADLRDTDAALLILMWRRELEAKQAQKYLDARAAEKSASKKTRSRKTPG